MAGKKIYVYSTLANDQKYTNWTDGGGDIKIPTSAVLIKGGAGVANDRIVTPMGVVTEIDEDQHAILQQNPGFLDHEKKGFVKVERRQADPEKVAADMDRNDPSAPITPAYYESKDSELDAKPRD